MTLAMNTVITDNGSTAINLVKVSGLIMSTDENESCYLAGVIGNYLTRTVSVSSWSFANIGIASLLGNIAAPTFTDASPKINDIPIANTINIDS